MDVGPRAQSSASRTPVKPKLAVALFASPSLIPSPLPTSERRQPPSMMWHHRGRRRPVGSLACPGAFPVDVSVAGTPSTAERRRDPFRFRPGNPSSRPLQRSSGPGSIGRRGTGDRLVSRSCGLFVAAWLDEVELDGTFNWCNFGCGLLGGAHVSWYGRPSRGPGCRADRDRRLTRHFLDAPVRGAVRDPAPALVRRSPRRMGRLRSSAATRGCPKRRLSLD